MKTKIYTTTLLIGFTLIFSACQNSKKETPVKKIETITLKADSLVKIEKVNTKETPWVNIQKHQKISSPLLIEINSKGLWHASEGEVGTVSLVDENNKTIATGILFTKDDKWMTSGDAFFKTTLTFDAKEAKSGSLIFKNRVVRKDDIELSFTLPVHF